MSYQNTGQGLDLSKLGVSKHYFRAIWLLATIFVTAIAYYAGPPESGLERVSAAVMFMIGYAAIPYIRGYFLYKNRHAAKPYVFRRGRRIFSDLLGQCVKHVAKHTITVFTAVGTHWYTFGYVGVEALPAWQLAMLMLVYLYCAGAIAISFASGSYHFPHWNRLMVFLHAKQ